MISLKKQLNMFACYNIAIRPYDLVEVGRTFVGNTQPSDDLSDTISKQTCATNGYTGFYNITGPRMICDYVFGTPVCCGGTITKGVNEFKSNMTNVCGLFDCFKDQWIPFQDLPIYNSYRLSYTTLRQNGRDVGWLVSGGETPWNIYYDYLDENYYDEEGMYSVGHMSEHSHYIDM